MALDLAQQSLALVGASEDPGTANLARFNMGLAKVLMGRLAEGRALASPSTSGRAAARRARHCGGELAGAGYPGADAGPRRRRAYREGAKLAQILQRDQQKRRLLEAGAL